MAQLNVVRHLAIGQSVARGRLMDGLNSKWASTAGPFKEGVSKLEAFSFLQHNR